MRQTKQAAWHPCVQRTSKDPIEWSIRLALIAVMLIVFMACATGRGEKPAKEDQADAEDKAPTVTRFEDGREGFVIQEAFKADATARETFNQAVILLKEEKYAEAIDLLEQVIAKSPGVTAPYIDLAIAYRHKGKSEQAEAHLKTALALMPGHPVACNEYGLLYRAAGRFAEAREMYETALEGFPEYYPAHRNLGILCDIYMNDPECALAHYEVYHAANPEDKAVALWIADLKNRMKGQ